MRISGIHAFLEILAAHGVRHIFGNPGTTELPLNDALVGDKRFDYILGLQEVPVMAMADGFAMASGTLGVVNLHISCGLGNAMGMLYNAWREGTPLLVTAGQQDRRLMFEEPILWGQMVDVTRPWTKWACEVQRVEDLPAATRRAIQTALTPPTGPVFMSLPIDVQMELAEFEDLLPPRLPDARVRPPAEALRSAAALLAGAKNPAILAGSRVTQRDAAADLVRIAEMLAAPVMHESGTTHGRLAFPTDHPLSALGLPLWSHEVRARLEAHDVILVVGMDLLRQYIYHEPSRAIPEHLKLVHLDEDPWQISKNYAVEVGLVGDTQAGLRELGDLLAAAMTPEQRAEAHERCEFISREHAVAREKLKQQIAAQRDERPMSPLTFMEALARVLPDNVAVIEEAVTTTNTTLERLGAIKNTTGYFGHRGWALGWGLGVTLGAKLAWPQRPVLGIIGEGALMYGVQALWSAAHHRIPATIVVPNNAQYKILKICAHQLKLPQAKQERYEALDVVSPEVDLVALSQSLGVRACRIHDPQELSERVAASLSASEPLLIDVPISRQSMPKLQYG
jgi:benzoylformate decarboxylase